MGGIISTGENYRKLAMQGFMQESADATKIDEVNKDLEANKKMQKDKTGTQAMGLAGAIAPRVLDKAGVFGAAPSIAATGLEESAALSTGVMAPTAELGAAGLAAAETTVGVGTVLAAETASTALAAESLMEFAPLLLFL